MTVNEALPMKFIKRDWNAEQYQSFEPDMQFEIYDGPTTGGLTSWCEPGQDIRIDAEGYCLEGQWMVLDVIKAKRLHADLTSLLELLEQ